jgi:hypothetical protein
MFVRTHNVINRNVRSLCSKISSDLIIHREHTYIKYLEESLTLSNQTRVRVIYRATPISIKPLDDPQCVSDNTSCSIDDELINVILNKQSLLHN